MNHKIWNTHSNVVKISPHGSKLLLIGWINNFDYSATFESEEQRFSQY